MDISVTRRGAALNRVVKLGPWTTLTADDNQLRLCDTNYYLNSSQELKDMENDANGIRFRPRYGITVRLKAWLGSTFFRLQYEKRIQEARLELKLCTGECLCQFML